MNLRELKDKTSCWISCEFCTADNWWVVRVKQINGKHLVFELKNDPTCIVYAIELPTEIEAQLVLENLC